MSTYPREPARDEIRDANERAWNIVARKYADEVDADVALLRAGGSTLLPAELATLTPLASHCRRAIHLQCSHGSDALSLWKLGAAEVVGIDISEEMLALARRKTELLGAPASWYRADVLDPPPSLLGTADLVYTGRGAIPWVLDLERWAQVVAGLLAPGGHLYLLEGHPLNALWMTERADLRLRDDAYYFARSLRANDDFPAKFLEQHAPGGEVPLAYERMWTLGDTITALASAGLSLIHLREHPEHFWPQFDAVPDDLHRRVPHTFSLLMRREVTPAG